MHGICYIVMTLMVVVQRRLLWYRSMLVLQDTAVAQPKDLANAKSTMYIVHDI